MTGGRAQPMAVGFVRRPGTGSWFSETEMKE